MGRSSAELPLLGVRLQTRHSDFLNTGFQICNRGDATHMQGPEVHDTTCRQHPAQCLAPSGPSLLGAVARSGRRCEEPQCELLKDRGLVFQGCTPRAWYSVGTSKCLPDE